MEAKASLQWFRVYGYYYPSNWPTRFEANTLDWNARSAKESFMREVVGTGNACKIEIIRRMGTIEEYRKTYGVDGQLDSTGLS